MEFSALTTFIIAIMSAVLSSAVTIIITVYRMTNHFATVTALDKVENKITSAVEKSEEEQEDRCHRFRSNCGQLLEKDKNLTQSVEAELRASIRELKKSSGIQYHMLRALVAYMPDLTNDQREKILNTGNSYKD